MIEDRKKDHIRICMDENVQYDQANGLDHYHLLHNALPECSLDEVNISTEFIGKYIASPFLISSMTGGYLNGGEINRQLAEIASTLKIPLGLGSQRIMVEKPETTSSFSVVREVSKDLIVLSNIGGVQLAAWDRVGELETAIDKIIESVSADALIVHLNPLQELVQPEGDTDFRGVLEAIAKTVSHLSPLPIIVKETGAGISAFVADQLLQQGVYAIDIAGAGGTSWSKVEYHRTNEQKEKNQNFGNWGIPTAHSLQMVESLRTEYTFKLIASGGIYSATDMLKSLILGANYCALATPIIKVLKQDGLSSCIRYLTNLSEEIKTGMCLLGVTSIDELNPSKHLYSTSNYAKF